MKAGERRLVYTSGAAGGALAGGSKVVSIVEALELVAVEESARVVPLLLPMIEFCCHRDGFCRGKLFLQVISLVRLRHWPSNTPSIATTTRADMRSP